MSLMEMLFGKKDTTPANVAKNRLTLVLAHERADNAFPWMEDLKADLMNVMKKYTAVKDIKVKSDKNHNIDLIEFEILLDK